MSKVKVTSRRNVAGVGLCALVGAGFWFLAAAEWTIYRIQNLRQRPAAAASGCFLIVVRSALWRSGVYSRNGIGRINEVALHRARLVLGWVTVFGRAYHLGL